MPNPDLPPNPPMTPAAAALTVADASASPISFARIASFPPPGWQVPRQVRFSPDGKLITYLQSESQSEQMALFAFDVSSREHRVLVRAKDLIDTDKPMSREEELRRERQRKRIKGVSSYAWAKKAPVMLLPLGGNVLVRKADGTIKQLTDSDAPEIDPKLCADGSKVVFVRGRELFVIDVQSGKETQLTSDAPAGITRGQSDFNMQEEFDEPSGLWWAPSCDRIAFLEVDERHVAKVPVLGFRDGADLQMHRYPRTGGKNPNTRLGVLDLASKKTTWIKMPAASSWDPADQYIGRLSFSKDGSALFFQRLSRDQKHLALVRSDVRSGAASHLAEHQDETWTAMSEVHPLGSDRLVTLWPHQGHQHLALRDASSGALLLQLTNGDWDVSKVVGIDEDRQRVLFIANKDATLDRQLYAVSLKGGAITRLSKEPGVHEIHGNNPAHGWADTHSATDRIPQATLHGPDGKKIGAITVPRSKDFDALKIRNPELVKLVKSGQPDLYGLLLKPRNMKAGQRYPTIVMVYGGPGVQIVSNQYNPRLLWQHLADRGFVIFQLDNRGSTGRGHAFEAPIHNRLGDIELEDQLRGADYLSGLDFVDSARLGIYGHSYGGYMVAMAMLRAPGRFKVGVSGSPVTDWRFYDTGYTERFMGTPQNNEAGYAASALSPLAGKLEGKLFIIHALMDENVHFEHTAKLIDALVAADKDFDLLVFPGERHGYRSPKARSYAYRRVAEYFAQNL